MNDFMKKLRSVFDKYKKERHSITEKIKKEDLAYIKICEENSLSVDEDVLREHLDYVSKIYQELRILEKFIELCEAELVV